MNGNTDTLACRLDVARKRQAAAISSDGIVVSCSAPPGQGGLGRHAEEVVDAGLRRGALDLIVCPSAGSIPHPVWPTGDVPWSRRALLAMPGIRGAPDRKVALSSASYDRAASRAPITGRGDLWAFAGQATHQIAAARRRARGKVVLIAANSHLQSALGRHLQAVAACPVERPWVSERAVRRHIEDYERADFIATSSEYVWQSFVDGGVSEERLVRFPLTPHPRYLAATRRPSETRDIVYVGSLMVHKGVHVLLEAMRAIRDPDVRLHLVGGWGTRGMRRHVEARMFDDARINVCPGDPLPVLERASLYCHPAYEEGYGYAAAEALAVGVRCLLSEDTGAKDLLGPGVAGQTLPTGETDIWIDAIRSELGCR